MRQKYGEYIMPHKFGFNHNKKLVENSKQIFEFIRDKKFAKLLDNDNDDQPRSQ